MSTEPAAVISAGQLLRQAREQRQLSVQQVAVQLNLKPSQVEQLEQDQLDGSMLETFARGYVRAYGRLLKLPEAELMAAFSRQTGCVASSAKPMRTFSNREAKQATENRFMWLTYAIIALLLLLLFIWWWQTARPVSDSASAPVETVAIPEIAAAEVAPVATPEQLHELLDQLMPSAEPVAAEPEPEAQLLPDQLEMRFSANCWVDVVDAEGNRVAYGTKQAGYVMQLTGKAPFVVTLGNPGVVQISYNQQPFDMSALPAGRVAKFSIPESE